MNFRLILFLITCLVIQSCKSVQQKKNTELNYIPYYLETYKADSLQIIGEDQKAFKKLDSLFDIYKPKNQFFIYELSNYLRLATKLNKTSNPNLKNNFRILVEEYGINADYIENDSLLNSCKNNLAINELEIKIWEENYMKSRNRELDLKIDSMFVKDQKSRGKFNEYEVDEENYQEIKQLIKKYGYLSNSKLGNKGYSYLTLMYFHMSRIDEFEELKNIIYENIKKGNALPYEILQLYNARSVIFYKTYYFGNDETFLGFKLHDEQFSNKLYNDRRKKYGLPSLEYSLWKQKHMNDGL